MNFLTDSNWNYVGITQRKKIEFLNNEVWEKKACFFFTSRKKWIKYICAVLIQQKQKNLMFDQWHTILPKKGCDLTVKSSKTAKFTTSNSYQGLLSSLCAI